MYTIIWKYKIKAEFEDIFEKEYGTNGAWYNLFEESEDYRGSILYKSQEEVNSYFLMDTWTTKESYEAFKKSCDEIYRKLSSQFEYLYETEEKIGTFNSLK